MQTRTIGGAPVSEIGFGVMNLSLDDHGPDEDGVRVIHAAIDAGMTLLDTADCYCVNDDDFHHNETLVGRALRERPADRDRVFLATKAGYIRPEGRWIEDGDPERIRASAEASLRALGVDRVDLLQLHTPDPRVPLARTMEAFARLKDEGKARMIGLSNVSLAELDEASKVVEVVSVQNEYSPYVLDPERNGILTACEQRGIAFLPYSPLGGRNKAQAVGTKGAFAAVAARHGVSPQQVVLAWMLAKSPAIIPIPGSRRIETARDSAAAADLELTADEIVELTASLGGGQ